MNEGIQKSNDHAQQDSTNTRALTGSAENENNTMTDPEYNPTSAPLGTGTVGRTPHPHRGVLNTSSGNLRGFCATRFRHVSSQEQFYTGGEQHFASLNG